MTEKGWKGNLRIAGLTLLLLGAAVAVAFAASGGGEHHADSGALLKDFIWRTVNFAVLVGLLVYFAAKPIRKGLAGRREDIAKRLEEARKAKEQAEAKFAEYDQKLDRAAAEIEEIKHSIRREGELEKEKTLAHARETAAKIEREAERTASHEVARARTELRRDAAHLAIEIAEGILKEKITSEDHNRLVEEYMAKVGELH